MTESQLLTLIENTFTTNGAGDITGHLTKDALTEIVQSVYDAIAAYTPGPPLVDDESIELDSTDHLQAKLYSPAYALPMSFNWAPVIKKQIGLTAFADGMYISVDGVTIGVNEDHELVSLVGTTGGGGGGNTVGGGNTWMDNFTGSTVEGLFYKVYPSIGSVNGYIKLDTGAGEDASYFMTQQVISSQAHPSFNVKAALSTNTSVLAFIGFSDTGPTFTGSPVGFGFVYDSGTASLFWTVVCANGGVVFSAATLIPVDADEHIFKSFHNNGVITWLVDGVEAYSKSYTLAAADLLLSVSLTDNSAVVNTLIADSYSVSCDKTVETPVFDTTEIFVDAYPKKYVAMISQAGGAAPSDTVLKNEIGKITWVRTSAGLYTGTAASNTFDAGLTTFANKYWSDSSGNKFTIVVTTDEVVTITSKTSGGAAADDLLDCTLEITNYTFTAIPLP